MNASKDYSKEITPVFHTIVLQYITDGVISSDWSLV